jgi:hypothetical protein
VCGNCYKPKNKYTISQAVQKFKKVKTAGRKCTNFTRSVLTAQELNWVWLPKLSSVSLVICNAHWTASTVPFVSLLTFYIRWTACTVSPVSLPVCYTYWTPDTVYFVSLLMCSTCTEHIYSFLSQFYNVLHLLNTGYFFHCQSCNSCYTWWRHTAPSVILVICYTHWIPYTVFYVILVMCYTW